MLGSRPKGDSMLAFLQAIFKLVWGFLYAIRWLIVAALAIGLLAEDSDIALTASLVYKY